MIFGTRFVYFMLDFSGERKACWRPIFSTFFNKILNPDFFINNARRKIQYMFQLGSFYNRDGHSHIFWQKKGRIPPALTYLVIFLGDVIFRDWWKISKRTWVIFSALLLFWFQMISMNVGVFTCFFRWFIAAVFVGIFYIFLVYSLPLCLSTDSQSGGTTPVVSDEGDSHKVDNSQHSAYNDCMRL